MNLKEGRSISKAGATPDVNLLSKAWEYHIKKRNKIQRKIVKLEKSHARHADIAGHLHIQIEYLKEK